MLREKTQTSRMWYEISDLMKKNSLAAVAELGASKAAGTARHNKCTSIATKLVKLDPVFGADAKAIAKLTIETSGLFPWNEFLYKAMATMEERLLMARCVV